ncbi:MAG TPA: polyprenyl synthetase family protein [Anaerolineae bacterium]|nr:polyprenyl synthetase family protein [Anaerolineae bacterium]
MTLESVFDRLLPLIETELQEIVRTPHHSLGTYFGMLQYHLGWADEDLRPIQANSGKRLRPVLCLLTTQALGGMQHQALPAAAAVELVHNFSLVHDDIQDGSHTRRGRRTVWDIWGLAHGINVGDGLFVLARLALHRLEDHRVPLRRQQAAIYSLDQACLALCEGQYFDMFFEDRIDVDLDQYLWMIRHKTAALLATSTQLGAIIATDDDSQIEGYRRFGEHLGMAFQIQDDILGAWGDPVVTGKSAAIDIRDKKKTLPVAFALNQSQDRDTARQLADLYTQEGPLSESDIHTALALLAKVGARQHAETMAEEYYRLSIQGLAKTGIQNAAQSSLHQLAASLLGRLT